MNWNRGTRSIGAGHPDLPRAVRMGGGGPVDDAEWRIIDVFGDASPRLYATGELSFGHLYLFGVSVAERLVTGRIAGCNVAAARAWR